MNDNTAIIRSFMRNLWAPGSVLALHWALYFAGAYEWYEDIDIALHVLGGAAVAFILARGVDAAHAQGLIRIEPLSVVLLLLVAGTALIAVAWEVFELLSDRLLGTRLLGDLGDTLADLLFGLAGAGLYAAVYRRSRAANRAQ